MAWGFLFYDRKLSEKEVGNYDLKADEEENRTASYGEHAYIQSMTDDELRGFVDTLENMQYLSELEDDYYSIAMLEMERRETENGMD